MVGPITSLQRASSGDDHLNSRAGAGYAGGGGGVRVGGGDDVVVEEGRVVVMIGDGGVGFSVVVVMVMEGVKEDSEEGKSKGRILRKGRM